MIRNVGVWICATAEEHVHRKRSVCIDGYLSSCDGTYHSLVWETYVHNAHSNTGTDMPLKSPLSKECVSPESPRIGAPPVPMSHGTPERTPKIKGSHSPVQYYAAGIEPLRSLNPKLTLSRVQDVFMGCANRGSVLNKRMVRDKSKLRMSSASVGSELGKESTVEAMDRNITNPSPVRLPPVGEKRFWKED